MIAALYARVSNEEQVEGYSIDAQIRAFETLVKAKGWTIYKVYVEEGKSAHTENINKRPVFKEAIADGLDRKYDILVVHKVDRFSRKLRITLEYFDKLGKADVGFVSIVEQMDFSTPWGKFTLTMLGGLAELYSDNLSQEVKKGLHERKAQGLYCGRLPFGVMKGEDGTPVPDMQERKADIDGEEVTVRNYEGLIMAFELGAQGKCDREVSIAINAGGYRAAGNGPFSKNTMGRILKNRFYVGELPNGNNGWVKGKHDPFIDLQLFDMAQEMRALVQWAPRTITLRARTYSISCVAWCNRCGGKIHIMMGPNGRPRVYCYTRFKVRGCDFSGTFLDVYEAQIEWYLENFVIPEDYQKKILEAHRKLEADQINIEEQRVRLKANLERLKKQHRWGHISDEEYLSEYKATERLLRQLAPAKGSEEVSHQLALFLANVAYGWRESSQEQRNKIARTLFEGIRLDSGGKVVAVKPQPKLEPFFKLNYECHSKDITLDPDRGRRLMQYPQNGYYPVLAPAELYRPAELFVNRREKLPVSLWPEIAERYKTESLRQLGKAYNVSRETIRKAIIKNSQFPNA